MADGPAPAAGGPAGEEAGETAFNQLLFKQELNEIYLLLDFISGRPDKHLSDLKDKIAKDIDGRASEKWSDDEVIQRISKIRYPPVGPTEEKSKDAAFLLLVKDALNAIAFPAKGMTIAYTILFADTGRSKKAKRSALASCAYPTLVNHAKWFRRINIALASAGLVFTVAAAILLWLVTYGVQLTARFEEAKRNDTASAARVFDQLNSLKVGGVTLASYDIAAICKLGKTVPVGQHQQPHSRPGAADASNQTQDRATAASAVKTTDTSAVRQACADYAFKHAQLCVTISDFAAYAQSPIFQAMEKLLPVHSAERVGECDIDPDGTDTLQSASTDGIADNDRRHDAMHLLVNVRNKTVTLAKSDAPVPVTQATDRMGRQEDAISIAGVLAVTSNYLLPILFGLCGSIVSVIRNVQNKIYESVLVPRDRALAMIRLPLGMIAGVCVGLFLSPDGAAKGTAGLGAFSLSASGIAFIAGYGAEAFFRTLDGIVDRIFVLEDPGKRRA